jgi:hypothetical protein
LRTFFKEGFIRNIYREICLKMGGGVSAVATTEFKRRLSRGSLLHGDAESVPTPPFYIKDVEITEDDQDRIRWLAKFYFFFEVQSTDA